MQSTGRPGHGERARVAARVRALLEQEVHSPPGALPDRLHDPVAAGWLPGMSAGSAAHHAGDGTPACGEPGELCAEGPSGQTGDPSTRRAARGTGHRRHPRWQADRRSTLSLALVVAVVAAATLWWVLSDRPSSVDLSTRAGLTGSAGPDAIGTALPAPSTTPARPAAGVSPPTSSPAVAALLVVDVAGRVRHPGVYQLPAGSRVVDALSAAGGALPGVSTATLNLAAPLRDGQQVAVGVPAAAGADPGAAAAPGAAAPVDLNNATLEQLEALPGVGPVLAQNILDWRYAHGRFSRIDELNQVTGIGAVKFATLRPRVTV